MRKPDAPNCSLYVFEDGTHRRMNSDDTKIWPLTIPPEAVVAIAKLCLVDPWRARECRYNGLARKGAVGIEVFRNEVYLYHLDRYSEPVVLWSKENE